MTEKRFVETISTGIVTDTITGKEYKCEMRIDDDLLELLNELHEENQALQRHIKRNTFNKIRVEDILNCAKYDKFYENEEAIKLIDWIAKELGVDFE